MEDESLKRKHTKEGLLSMANRGDNGVGSPHCWFSPHSKTRNLCSIANVNPQYVGPNTATSQFFITTRPTPHLDGKHVVFGQVVSGYEVVEELEKVQVDEKDKPLKDVRIVNCGELELRLPKGMTIEEFQKRLNAKKAPTAAPAPSSKSSKRKKREDTAEDSSEEDSEDSEDDSSDDEKKSRSRKEPSKVDKDSQSSRKEKKHSSGSKSKSAEKVSKRKKKDSRSESDGEVEEGSLSRTQSEQNWRGPVEDRTMYNPYEDSLRDRALSVPSLPDKEQVDSKGRKIKGRGWARADGGRGGWNPNANSRRYEEPHRQPNGGGVWRGSGWRPPGSSGRVDGPDKGMRFVRSEFGERVNVAISSNISLVEREHGPNTRRRESVDDHHRDNERRTENRRDLKADDGNRSRRIDPNGDADSVERRGSSPDRRDRPGRERLHSQGSL
ncbi:hypothetical protein HDU93_000569 [Gonapodya sp. JEL0774]|nr:hypothetical protein HDU93_000569 [Gonapodya sp. JEL0774]